MAFIWASSILLGQRSGENPSPTAHGIPATPGYRTPEEMLDGAESEIDFGEAALVLSKQQFPEVEVGVGLRELERIAARVRALLAVRNDKDDPRTRIGAINTVLFREEAFRYDLANIHGEWHPENRLIGTLLTKRTGTCANLPLLYYAIAERLALPVHLVDAPEHSFLRYELDNGSHINIEATSFGGTSPDEDYVSMLETSDSAIHSGWMMRSLSKREALGILIDEASHFAFKRGDYPEAEHLALRLGELRPEHGGNWWNLALLEAKKARVQQERELGRNNPPPCPSGKRACIW